MIHELQSSDQLLRAGEKTLQTVRVLGGEAQSGAYILRLRQSQPLSMRFGRFHGGRALALDSGEYLYVGSAMAQKGASSLARRLVRHATRRNGPPHAIRQELLAELARLELGNGDLRPRGQKRLFWHVDHFLEPAAVHLTHVLAIRSAARLETQLAVLLAALPYTTPAAPGLGASDAPGATHLFAVQPVAGWWAGLLKLLQEQLPTT